MTKVAIPQADEQQRLLANLIGFMNADRKPLPKFWYLPRGYKAAIVMTGDDHGNNGTAGRFDIYKADSAPGCSVDDWQCVRATSYIFPTRRSRPSRSPRTSRRASRSALHMRMSGPATGSDACNNFTPGIAQRGLLEQLVTFARLLPGLPAVRTNRTHCIVWSDYDTQPQVELAHGMRFDTNYYYWPGEWMNNVPGLFTGSGMPMRFAKADGTMIDVYQATTQMTDESGQTYPVQRRHAARPRARVRRLLRRVRRQHAH